MYDAIVIGARVAGAPTAMLLARKGYKVLLVDRGSFPSDTMSTHYIHQPGTAALQRWGLMDEVLATGCPRITSAQFHLVPCVMNGWGPASEGVDFALAPRRYLLDQILIDAAVNAGVEFRQNFNLDELVFAGDKVTGIRGHQHKGAQVEETASLVIGADGRHSRVAHAVGAEHYNERPALGCYYYSYWSGLPAVQLEAGAGDGNFFVSFPTNDGLVCVGVGLRNDQFASYKADIDGTVRRTIEELSPSFAALLSEAKREEAWVGTADLPNFFCKPYGNGWALVGDAGYHKDPVTGYGITDSFRDAQSLADAVIEGFSGRSSMTDALAAYEQRRNEFAFPMYDLICQFASMDVPPPEMQALMQVVSRSQEETSNFFGLLDGTVSIPAFFAEENIGRIMTPVAV